MVLPWYAEDMVDGLPSADKRKAIARYARKGKSQRRKPGGASCHGHHCNHRSASGFDRLSPVDEARRNRRIEARHGGEFVD